LLSTPSRYVALPNLPKLVVGTEDEKNITLKVEEVEREGDL
jgi:hypothetical protein